MNAYGISISKTYYIFHKIVFQNLYVKGVLFHYVVKSFTLILGNPLQTLILKYSKWAIKSLSCAISSDGSGSNIFGSGRVGSAIYGLGLNLENFP